MSCGCTRCGGGDSSPSSLVVGLVARETMVVDATGATSATSATGATGGDIDDGSTSMLVVGEAGIVGSIGASTTTGGVGPIRRGAGGRHRAFATAVAT